MSIIFRKRARLLIVACFIFPLLSVLAQQAINLAPLVIPALREWQRVTVTFAIQNDVILPADAIKQLANN